MKSLDGQPAYVADALRLLVARRELIEHTVLDAWRTAKREKVDTGDEIGAGVGAVLFALAKIDTSDVVRLVDFLAEGSGLAELGRSVRSRA